ncbi:hypothetical protein C8Q74DRAFT_1302369 [Fomes fomentarius]|nr:hypothetical protein C8Q74DRAFT_1302369 [Fomes fomentarius]
MPRYRAPRTNNVIVPWDRSDQLCLRHSHLRTGVRHRARSSYSELYTYISTSWIAQNSQSRCVIFASAPSRQGTDSFSSLKLLGPLSLGLSSASAGWCIILGYSYIPSPPLPSQGASYLHTRKSQNAARHRGGENIIDNFSGLRDVSAASGCAGDLCSTINSNLHVRLGSKRRGFLLYTYLRKNCWIPIPVPKQVLHQAADDFDCFTSAPHVPGLPATAQSAV